MVTAGPHHPVASCSRLVWGEGSRASMDTGPVVGQRRVWNSPSAFGNRAFVGSSQQGGHSVVPMSCMMLCYFWGSQGRARSRMYSLWYGAPARPRPSRWGRTFRGFSGSHVTYAAFDPELHGVMELASDSELQELSNILYGTSLLSPLVKSVAPGDGWDGSDIRDTLREAEYGGRLAVIERLESRFLFLAADAKATLSGRRPRYRDVLLSVRKKLQVPCPVKLSTEDLEAEIFLHLLNEYSRPKRKSQFVRKMYQSSYANDFDDFQTRRWNGNIFTALKLGGEELLTMMLKGGSAVTMSTLQAVVSKELSGKVLVESVRYRLAKDALVKGGQAIAAKLEGHVAVLAARQGLAGATARYFTLRSTMMLLGPLLWGTFLADMAIRSVGTDYARVIRAIFAFAQIRITRTYGWTQSDTA